MKYKVYSYNVDFEKKQIKIIVATTTIKKAIELFETTSYYIDREYIIFTEDNTEINFAMSKPEQIFIAGSSVGDDFNEYGRKTC